MGKFATRKEVIAGRPDKKHVSTSYVECQNLTMRMHVPVHTANQRVLNEV